MHTEKEIRNITEYMKKEENNINKFYEENKGLFQGFLRISLIGCGSSYYLAKGISTYINRHFHEEISRALTGSEVMLGLRNFEDNEIIIGISRSGESTETVKALEYVKNNYNLKVFGITCEEKTSIERISDATLILSTAKEKSVVMTGSFGIMAYSLTFLFKRLMKKEFNSKNFIDFAESMIKNSFDLFEKAIDVSQYEHFVFLGYDEYFAASEESALKLTEMALVDSRAYQTLEFRHGPMSKVTEESLLVIYSNKKTFDDEENLAKDMKNLGATVLIFGDTTSVVEKEGIYYIPWNLKLMENNDDWFLRIILAQVMGLKKSLSKGLNPDKPKNLNKVVII